MSGREIKHLLIEGYRAQPHKFLRDICGLTIKDFHRRWLDLRRYHKRTLLLAPRGHGKSEVATIGYCEYRIAYDPNIRILIVSASATNALRFSGKLRAECEKNNKLLSLFPGCGKDKNSKWTDAAFTVCGRNRIHEIPTVTALGVGSAVTSGHYDLVILDDPIDLEDVTNEDMLRKKLEWFDNVLDPVADSEMHISGTRWHMADMYGTLMGRNKVHPEFEVLVDKALFKEGEDCPYPREFQDGYACLWPDGPERNCTLDRLLQLKVTNPQAFAMQRQNEPTGGPLAKFRQEWFKYAEYKSERTPMVFQGVDLSAFGEKATSDYFTIVTIAFTGAKYDSGIHILDVLRIHQPTFKDQIAAVIQQIAKWRPIACGIETNQYQQALYQSVVDKGAEFATVLRKIGVSKDKVIRAIRLSNAYETGRVYHPPAGTTQWLADYELELIQFPLGAHDDQVDGATLATNMAFDVMHEVVGKGTSNPYDDVADLEFGGAREYTLSLIHI